MLFFYSTILSSTYGDWICNRKPTTPVFSYTKNNDVVPKCHSIYIKNVRSWCCVRGTWGNNSLAIFIPQGFKESGNGNLSLLRDCETKTYSPGFGFGGILGRILFQIWSQFEISFYSNAGHKAMVLCSSGFIIFGQQKTCKPIRIFQTSHGGWSTAKNTYEIL